MSSPQYDQPPPPSHPPPPTADRSPPGAGAGGGGSDIAKKLVAEGSSDDVLAVWLCLDDTATPPVWQALRQADQVRLNTALDYDCERVVGVRGGRWEVILPRGTRNGGGDGGVGRNDSLGEVGGDWGGRTFEDDVGAKATQHPN